MARRGRHALPVGALGGLGGMRLSSSSALPHGVFFTDYYEIVLESYVASAECAAVACIGDGGDVRFFFGGSFIRPWIGRMVLFTGSVMERISLWTSFVRPGAPTVMVLP